jgi:shikimate kinase
VLVPPGPSTVHLDASGRWTTRATQRQPAGNRCCRLAGALDPQPRQRQPGEHGALGALEADNRGKVVSSPRVITADKKKAVISQGTDIPYLTASASGATTIQFKPAVLELSVTPRITPDDRIIMDLEVKKDTVGAVIGTSTGTIPSIDTKKVNTQVLVDNGDTVVLGGIFEQETRTTTNKVPFLGDLPLVGYLFKRTTKQDDKTELLIFVTPKDREGHAHDPLTRFLRQKPRSAGAFFSAMLPLMTAGASQSRDPEIQSIAMAQGNIFLVGMMGAGKTTLGRALAHRLQLEFVDTDRVLVERTGVPVATIFEFEGEEGFRRPRMRGDFRARRAGRAGRGHGGGAVLSEDNRRVMRDHGTVIYLRARLESLWQRTRHDSSRPLLATPDPRATLAELLDHRDPLYRDVAHIVVDTGAQSAASVVGKVIAALRAGVGRDTA